MAEWSLSRRFAAAGGLIMLAAMLGIGLWVTTRIESGVVRNTANATALFMDAFIAPLAQELAEADTLSIGPIRAIEEMMDGTGLGDRVVSVKIWKPDGLVAYASDIGEIGKRYPPSRELERAFTGDIVGGLSDLSAEENVTERKLASTLLEVYSPIRESFTGKVIAVAEFYEKADALDEALGRARLQSWIAVVAITALIGAGLFGIVDAGSRTIDRQRVALVERVDELQRMSQENRALRRKVERASGRVSAIGEAHLRQLSADLHDGPAQLVGFAALRLDALRRIGDRRQRNAAIAELENVLNDAVREIRDIGRGLSLPNIEHMAIDEVAEHAIAAHERRTGESVRRVIRLGEAFAPESVKACLYRFVQEGLNNAWRHSPGADVLVDAALDGSRLAVRIANGPGTRPVESQGGGMGLAGLRDRVESLGGSFAFSRLPQKGAELSMSIDLAGGTADE